MKVFASILFIAVIACFCPPPAMRWAFRLGRLTDKLAAHRRACIFGIGLLSLLSSFAWNLVLKTPAPRCHDEFGYLLEGETFSHGRLKNPTPPMWRHFATFQDIFEPAYTAKYPPAQGVMLAMGDLFGKPILGVWLSTALACAAVLWMLFAWLPPRWALPVAVLTSFNPGIMAWNWIYWGGSVAFGAGALVLGSYRRMADAGCKENPVKMGLLMGIGMAILAISRPYEGFVLSATVIGLLLYDLAAERRLEILRMAALLWIVVLAAAAAFILSYNKNITGNAFLLPYVLYQRTYDPTPLFLWMKMPPFPHYPNTTMRDFYSMARDSALTQKTLGGFVRGIPSKIVIFSSIYWAGASLVFFLAAPLTILKDRWLARAAWILLISAGAIAMYYIILAHYEAPVIPLVFVIMGACMQRIWQWKVRNRPAGAFFVTAMTLLLLSFSIFSFYIRQRKNEEGANWGFRRVQIASDFARNGHKNLILIRYSPGHDLNQEWVFNAADIEGAPVLWARDLGPDQNRELLDYYKDRMVWVFNPDTDTKPQAYANDANGPGGPSSI